MNHVVVTSMGRLTRIFLLISIMSLLISCKDSYGTFVVIEMPNIKTNLFLQGASFSDVKITESSEEPKIKSNQRIVLYGYGVIEYKEFRVQYSDDRLSIGEEILTIESDIVLNYILTVDGQIKTGFLRSFD